MRWQRRPESRILHDVSTPSIDPAIKTFYDRTPEEERLELGPFQLERARTRELILRHAHAAPAVVLDVGGAAGAYAFWLAELGYEVHLVDATPRLVDIARQRNETAKKRLASANAGDARALTQPDESASIVLLLGPLYHLVDARDRHRALTEALRVLRPGGLLFAAGISRFASALDGLSRDLLGDDRFVRIVQGDLSNGRHSNPTDRLDYFTTAYFHRPSELRGEVAAAGFDVAALYGIEGPAWILTDFDARWSDPTRREAMLHVARMLESDPDVVGSSAHLLAVARKPTSS